MSRGKFISLEGGEGSGKSTLLKALEAVLVGQGIDLVITREPGGTLLAESVRDLVLNPPEGESWSPMAQALLMSAARSDHLEKKIRPALARGQWVLTDRFSDSTRAYQGVGGVETRFLDFLTDLVVGPDAPDLTLILDADPEDLLQRREARGTSDAFEAQSLAFHQHIRQQFLAIAERHPERCVVISALGTPDEVAANAIGAIDERLA